MEKKDYLAPLTKVKFIAEEESILASSTPTSITISESNDDIINEGYVDAKRHHSYGMWDEDDEDEER